MAATAGGGPGGEDGLRFQSPCHRVNGCNNVSIAEDAKAIKLSVPLSSGQWLQPAAAGGRAAP